MLDVLIFAAGTVVIGLLLLAVAWRLLKVLGWAVTKGCGCMLALLFMAIALGLLLVLVPMFRAGGPQ